MRKAAVSFFPKWLRFAVSTLRDDPHGRAGRTRRGGGGSSLRVGRSVTNVGWRAGIPRAPNEHLNTLHHGCPLSTGESLPRPTLDSRSWLSSRANLTSMMSPSPRIRKSYPGLRRPCSSAERIVSSTNCPWLYEGVTMLTRGHGQPWGMVPARRPASSLGRLDSQRQFKQVAAQQPRREE